MSEEGEGDHAPNTAAPTPSGRPGDGSINFSVYTLAQLQELQFSIDRQAFPENFKNLLAELERREHAPTQLSADISVAAGRFTRYDGLRGWLQTKMTRSPVYGSGSVEVRPSQILLRGWQRTWLGAPVQTEIALPTSSILYAKSDGARVGLSCKRPYRRVSQIEFRADDPEQAAQLIAALRAGQAAPFDRRWVDISDFYGRLRTLCPRVWGTLALVVLNVAIYLALVVSARRLGAFDPQLLMTWGANYGPLTINGQWWRLISALFVHLNLMHLLLNMWALWNIGRLSERLFGRWVFLFLYFAAGGLASLSSIAWDPTRASVGASGAIFGILGAFLAFLVHRRTEVPGAIIRAHWISTLAFVVFNLISGSLQTGIDNAAHVGGLVSGLILGYLAARPLDKERRLRMPLPQMAGAGVFLAAAILAALWQVKGIGAQLTGPEQFIRAHGWYANGEASNLQLWQQLAQQAGAGTISDAELGRRFHTDILPFWKSANERFQKESGPVPGPQRPFALLVEEFARDRLEWSQTIIDAVTNSDPQRAAAAQKLGEQTDLVQAQLDRLVLRATMDHRPRALANSALVVQLRKILFLDRWKCVEAPAILGRSVSSHDAKDDAPAQRQGIGCQAQRLFMNGDYASLDTLMQRSAKHQADLLDGGSSYGAITGGLEHLFRYGKLDITEALGRTSDWRRAVHDPVEPDIVEAMLFSDWAWAVRGHGYANSVSPQAWRIFSHRTEMAAAGLRETAARASSSPLWYELSLSVGLDQSMDAEKLRDIFNRGSGVFPTYLPLYQQMLRSLMPRWGGSYEAVDKFINDVYQQTYRRLGFEMYTRLYWIHSSLEGDEVDIFSDADADWKVMRRGFEEMMRHYPRSDVVLNGYANFACRAGDREAYQALRPIISTRESASVWSDKFSIQICDKRFAATTTTGGPTSPGTTASEKKR